MAKMDKSTTIDPILKGIKEKGLGIGYKPFEGGDSGGLFYLLLDSGYSIDGGYSHLTKGGNLRSYPFGLIIKVGDEYRAEMHPGMARCAEMDKGLQDLSVGLKSLENILLRQPANELVKGEVDAFKQKIERLERIKSQYQDLFSKWINLIISTNIPFNKSE